MSEYIESEYEISENGREAYVSTNLMLAQGPAEAYGSAEAMSEGTPLAQALAQVEGISGLRIERQDLIIYADGSVPWHTVLSDVSRVLKDFYL
jgi:hypothetical protein